MIEGISPVGQAFLGTIFTWAMTAAGSALVFLFSSGQRKILDGSLGFAAGVMTAASYWSLLDPAIETAKSSQLYGAEGQYAFIPVAIGFIVGAGFVYGADKYLPSMGDPTVQFALTTESKPNEDLRYSNGTSFDIEISTDNTVIDTEEPKSISGSMRRRGPSSVNLQDARGSLNDCGRTSSAASDHRNTDRASTRAASWRRITLLILAIVVHNIPEGLAVGVAFGAIGKTSSATFASARSLAIGIGIQNFPEGLAVSLPLRGSGMSVWKSFWYGQLSGMVEPIAGVLGAVAIMVAEPLLPYTLAFAAGAMIYVVIDDIIPEAQTCGNGKIASVCSIIGFVVMMSLDVGLG